MKRGYELLVIASIVGAVAPGCEQILGLNDDYHPPASSGDGGAAETGGAAASSSSDGAGGTGGAASQSSASSSTSAGGGFADDPCPVGSTADFKDDFNDGVSTSPWNPFVSNSGGAHMVVQEKEGLLTIRTDGTQGVFGGYYWNDKTTRSLLGCHAFIEVPVIDSPDNKLFVTFELDDDSESMGQIDVDKRKSLNIDYENKQINFSVQLGTVKQPGAKHIPYDPIAHRWWGFRESKGVTYFMTSADGKTWVTQFSIQTPSFASIVRADIAAGATQTAKTGEARFDNLNIPPP